MRGDKVDRCAAIEAMRLKSKESSRVEGITVGTNDRRHCVAQDMLRKNLPLTLIVEISKLLSEEIVRSIAN